MKDQSLGKAWTITARKSWRGLHGICNSWQELHILCKFEMILECIREWSDQRGDLIRGKSLKDGLI